MKKPYPPHEMLKARHRMIKIGLIKRDAHGYHGTPRQYKVDRLCNKEDFGLTPVYFAMSNPRSLHSTARRFCRKGWSGALGMDWLKHVR